MSQASRTPRSTHLQAVAKVPASEPQVDLVAGRAGSPTPTERRAFCLALLRRGEPPPGWIARQAKTWGLAPQLVSVELAEARAELAASRTPDAAQLLAHEQVQQSIEAADRIEALAADLDDPADRITALEKAAKLRQNAAKTLQAIYKKPGTMLLGQMTPPGPLSAADLRGGK